MKTKLNHPSKMFLVAAIGFASLTSSTLGAEVSVKAPALPAEIRQGLILYYGFDNEPLTGNLADESGHGNTGLPVNVQWVKDGHHGGAASFGLTNSYITVSNNMGLNPAQFTTAAWIKTSFTSPDWLRIFDKSVEHGFDLTMCGDYQGKTWRGKVAMEVAGGWAPSSIIVADGQWHHVVGTFSQSDIRIYVDGNQVGKGRSKIQPAPTMYDLTIGRDRSSPNVSESYSSFNGMMDDVMMFNRALSADEVQVLFKSQGGVLGPKPAQPPPPAGTPGKPAAADRLKQVKSLYDQGLINKEDYDKKVKEIMDSL